MHNPILHLNLYNCHTHFAYILIHTVHLYEIEQNYTSKFNHYVDYKIKSIKNHSYVNNCFKFL